MCFFYFRLSKHRNQNKESKSQKGETTNFFSRKPSKKGEKTGTIKITSKNSCYVRALFDYKPDDLSYQPLSFNIGDILHVINAGDDYWWKAKKVSMSGSEEETGIIPSKLFLEKKQQKNVSFQRESNCSLNSVNNTLKMRLKSLSISTEILVWKKDKFDKKERVNSKASLTSDFDGVSEENIQKRILTYEKVEAVLIDYKRPIIFLGLLKERLSDDFLRCFPRKFGRCVPHTTRQKRENELEGIDYYFISREEMERGLENHKFIEVGQYMENLYGTSIESVKDVAVEEDRHCLLDVSGEAIRRLNRAKLYPIVIFVKPKSTEQILEWSKRITDEKASKMFLQTLSILETYREHITGVIEADTPEEVYIKAKSLIEQNQNATKVWISIPGPGDF